MGLAVSDAGSTEILNDTRLLPPIKPNTSIKISGNARLKITAEGLRKMELKLAFVIDSIAANWLYLLLINILDGKSISLLSILFLCSAH